MKSLPRCTLPFFLSCLILAGYAASPTLSALKDRSPADSDALDGVRFFPGDGTLYVSPEEIGRRLHLDYEREPPGDSSGADRFSLAGTSLPAGDIRSLPDGSIVVPLRDLSSREPSGRSVEWDGVEQCAQIRSGDEVVTVRAGWRSVVAGITFARAPNRLWAPAGELRGALALPEGATSDDEKIERRQLLAGPPAELLAVDRLPWKEVRVEPFSGSPALRLLHEGREAWITEGDKRVAISLAAQELRAWQGDRLVLTTHVSTGRPGHSTPRGSFRAGPLKTRLLISHKYNDAPMPWSVQVRGDVMIHGFPSVPLQPASHGCIRVPLSGANPAHWFYDWVTIGTPISIARNWPETAGGHAGEPPAP